MTPENLAYLQSKKTKLKYLVQSQSGQLDAKERENFMRIIREEFRPGYSTDLWCSPCVFKMVELLHKKFEEWEQQQVKAEEPEVKPAEPIVVQASFPVNEKPEEAKLIIEEPAKPIPFKHKKHRRK